MKNSSRLKQDYKKLIAAMKNKDMFGIYTVGASNPYYSALFFAAEKALRPARKIPLKDRLAMWRHSRYLCHPMSYA